MQRNSVTCPSCSRTVSIISVPMPGDDESGRNARGTVLKRCPDCRKWSWMTPQTQTAT